MYTIEYGQDTPPDELRRLAHLCNINAGWAQSDVDRWRSLGTHLLQLAEKPRYVRIPEPMQVKCYRGTRDQMLALSSWESEPRDGTLFVVEERGQPDMLWYYNDGWSKIAEGDFKDYR